MWKSSGDRFCVYIIVNLVTYKISPDKFFFCFVRFIGIQYLKQGPIRHRPMAHQTQNNALCRYKMLHSLADMFFSGLLSLQSLLSMVSLMAQLSRCIVYYHTALLQLQTIADVSVLVCSMKYLLTFVLGGAMTMAWLTSRQMYILDILLQERTQYLKSLQETSR